MKDHKNTEVERDEIMRIISRVIEKEKLEESNPFLSERIMAEIENFDTPGTIPFFYRTLKIAAIAASLILIIFTGVNIGNSLGESLKAKNESVILNDDLMERIQLLTSE